MKIANLVYIINLVLPVNSLINKNIYIITYMVRCAMANTVELIIIKKTY